MVSKLDIVLARTLVPNGVDFEIHVSLVGGEGVIPYKDMKSPSEGMVWRGGKMFKSNSVFETQRHQIAQDSVFVGGKTFGISQT